MAKGGKRPGAGRPKGAQTRRKRAVAIQAAAEGVTPVQVMLGVMRAAWSEAVDPEGRIVNMKAAVLAASLGKDAAPYIHPRLSAVDARLRHSFEDLTEEELDREIAKLQGGQGEAGGTAG